MIFRNFNIFSVWEFDELPNEQTTMIGKIDVFMTGVDEVSQLKNQHFDSFWLTNLKLADARLTRSQKRDLENHKKMIKLRRVE